MTKCNLDSCIHYTDGICNMKVQGITVKKLYNNPVFCCNDFKELEKKEEPIIESLHVEEELE